MSICVMYEVEHGVNELSLSEKKLFSIEFDRIDVYALSQLFFVKHSDKSQLYRQYLTDKGYKATQRSVLLSLFNEISQFSVSQPSPIKQLFKRETFVVVGKDRKDWMADSGNVWYIHIFGIAENEQDADAIVHKELDKIKKRME